MTKPERPTGQPPEAWEHIGAAKDGFNFGQHIIETLAVPPAYTDGPDRTVYVGNIATGVGDDANSRLRQLPGQTMDRTAIDEAAYEIATKYSEFLKALDHYNLLPTQEQHGDT